jgi:tripartite-type tricarboxylate transporter receptor subunit TctC
VNVRSSRWLLVGCLVMACATAWAQAYPSRPIRLVVPFPPGGTTDILARLLGKGLHEAMGVPVTVDNRPGASSNIGTELVARAAPDGYTLLLSGATSFAVNPHLFPALPFDPLKDFAPIAPVAQNQTVLLVHPSVAARTTQELIALAKARPGMLNYASYGNGTVAHLAAARFASMAGIDITHIPYKGAAAAMTDLMGGQVDMMFDSIVTALPAVRSGRVRALAVSGAQRSPAAPDLPTVAESGVPGYAVVGWFGVVAPAGTPAEIVRRLNTEINRALSRDDVRAQVVGTGADPMSMSPEAFAAFIRSEHERIGRLIRASGARAE